MHNLPSGIYMKGGDGMHDELIKQMIKHRIDSTNLWAEIKSDLKFIVDCSRTFTEMALNIELYLICLNNYWQYRLPNM